MRSIKPSISVPANCERRNKALGRLLRGGLVGERVGPSPRRQLGDQTVGVRGDPEQDIFQIVEGWDVDECTALDERIEERGATGALEAAREEPVLPTDGDHAELVRAVWIGASPDEDSNRLLHEPEVHGRSPVRTAARVGVGQDVLPPTENWRNGHRGPGHVPPATETRR